ncbi:hypothetical protein [Cohnella sp. GCM10012308]|uniref:hypothetical protein n=1 Tax=Cohnella sp. GCM10012308 TaxID=3317329 RepID=UPI003612ED74
MAHGRFSLTIEGEEKLFKLMSELDWNEKRPEALKLAYVKGLTFDSIPPKREGKKTKHEVGSGVLAKGEEYMLYKHIMMEKLGEPLDESGFDDYMVRYIEQGLDTICEEIDSLSDLDNYFLYLVSKHV